MKTQESRKHATSRDFTESEKSEVFSVLFLFAHESAAEEAIAATFLARRGMLIGLVGPAVSGNTGTSD